MVKNSDIFNLHDAACLDYYMQPKQKISKK